MKNCDIIHELAQKVIDTFYTDWHHEGHIEVEHNNDFEFTLDGKRYHVALKEVEEYGCMGSGK